MNKILVISHDAGGANVLAALINKYNDKFIWNYYVESSAAKIFKIKKVHLFAKKILLNKNYLDKAFYKSKFDLLLTGTSWNSNLERSAIRAAKKNKIITMTLLDHWVNYRERFGDKDNWKKNLPDYILVGDELAYLTAKDLNFPRQRILKIENPYFEDIIKKSKLIKPISTIKKILYISEPVIRNVNKKISPMAFYDTEFETLEDILTQINYSREYLELRIRLHPSEKINKYNKLLTKKFKNPNYYITFSDPNKVTLINDCLSSDLVIGIQSMALFVAYLLKRKTLCYLSNNKSINYLNYWGIEAIRNKEDILKRLKLYQRVSDPRIEKIYSGNLFSTKIKNLL